MCDRAPHIAILESIQALLNVQNFARNFPWLCCLLVPQQLSLPSAPRQWCASGELQSTAQVLGEACTKHPRCLCSASPYPQRRPGPVSQGSQFCQWKIPVSPGASLLQHTMLLLQPASLSTTGTNPFLHLSRRSCLAIDVLGPVPVCTTGGHCTLSRGFQELTVLELGPAVLPAAPSARGAVQAVPQAGRRALLAGLPCGAGRPLAVQAGCVPDSSSMP